jgi:hypothetical protein
MINLTPFLLFDGNCAEAIGAGLASRLLSALYGNMAEV